jgi:L,D-peptidoglycan transpeptidase YkuD (ErfK/YbiS/YcfS/YnhG family)
MRPTVRLLVGLVTGILIAAGLLGVLPARAAVLGDTLAAGQQLAGGDGVASASGAYSLDVQADGNAVVYAADRRVLWSSGTYANPGARLVLQADGNAVVYSTAGRALWNSGTWGNPGSRLLLQDDGNLVLYRSNGTAAWFTGWDQGPPLAAATGDSMQSGQQLGAGQSLTSPNGSYTLLVQTDGNVVTYAAGTRVLWNTGTWGAAGARLVLQSDGNLVVRASNGVAVWNSGTWANPGSRLTLQNDGNLVLYRSNGSAAWYTGWDRGPLPLAVDTGASTQLVTVVVPSAGSSAAQLTAWELRSGRWVSVLGPVTARVGASGVGIAREGLSRTPSGTFTLTESFGRAANPGAQLPYRVIDSADWWVSDVNSSLYNRYARCARGTCPFNEAAGENLYAQGAVYDHAVVIDYNRAGTPGAGSAFFLHVTNGAATAGCVAIDRASLVTLLQWLKPGAAPLISIGVG